MEIVNDIHEQNLRTDLQQRFAEGWSTALKEEAYGKAFSTAEASDFWEEEDDFSDGEEHEAGTNEVVYCSRITAI